VTAGLESLESEQYQCDPVRAGVSEIAQLRHQMLIRQSFELATNRFELSHDDPSKANYLQRRSQGARLAGVNRDAENRRQELLRQDPLRHG